MEQKLYISNEMSLKRPKLRRRGAGLKFFTSTGNTQDQFESISS